MPLPDGDPVDLRAWLRAVESVDGVRTLRGADRDLEIGAISEMNYQQGAPRALLFDDIVGHEAGMRVLTGSVSDARRLGLTLRLGEDLEDARLVEELRGRPNEWAAAAASHAPRVVGDGPVLDNVAEGDQVDLTAFPSPFWHEQDGGRFIGTGCMVLTSDPDTGALNGGAYRLQVIGPRTVTVNAVPGKHGAQNIDRWFARAGRAPVTVSLGHDPVLLVTAGTDVPAGTSELDYAGAIAGRPAEVIGERPNGLVVPAHAEIVLEGWLRPERTEPEGPFGEWTGYYSSSEQPVLALDVETLSWRDNPIILGAPPARPPHDYSYMRSVVRSSIILDDLQASGVQGVQSVWAHEAGGGRLLITVAIQQRFPGHSRQVAYLTAQGQAGAYMNRYVVVVDDDIDPRSLEEVVWAVCTRSDPGRDVEIMRRTWGSKADPLVEDQSVPYNSRAIIDACRPYEDLATFPPVAVASPDLRRRVRDRWAEEVFGS